MKEIHQSFQLSLTSKNLVQLLNNNNFAYLKNILKSIIKSFKIKINKQNLKTSFMHMISCQRLASLIFSQKTVYE